MREHIWSVAIVALVASSPCWAEYPDSVIYEGAESLSRDQVRVELEHARTHGLIPQSEGDYPIIHPMQQTKTRAEVLQALKQAREDGLLDFADHEYPVIQTTR